MANKQTTTTDKIKNTIGDVKTIAKQAFRNLKRESRNAFGNESVVKDIKDKVNDSADEAINEGKKAKRSVKK